MISVPFSYDSALIKEPKKKHGKRGTRFCLNFKQKTQPLFWPRLGFPQAVMQELSEKSSGVSLDIRISDRR